MISWAMRHPYITGGVAVWIFNNIVTVLVSSLPAPTKDSSAKYVYWFKVANTIIGNLARAKSTALELSPNFQDALNKALEQMGLNRAGLPLSAGSIPTRIDG